MFPHSWFLLLFLMLYMYSYCQENKDLFWISEDPTGWRPEQTFLCWEK